MGSPSTSTSSRRRSVGPERLEAVLASLVASLVPDAAIPGTGRRYERLDVGADLAGLVDGWLIAWPPGMGLGMHDHQGSDAVLAVVRSSLRERYLAPTGVRQRSLRPGRPVRLAPDHVHEVVNTSVLEAVSVHLYSPPLRDTSFREDRAIEFVLVGS
jgi:predicted metal-dependent enzyme (double-stranded beta helix superfamily)